MTAIVTERLTLRHTSVDEWDDNINQVVKWLNDTSLMKYSEQRHHVHSRKTQEIYIGQFNGNGNYREIYAREKFIGTITANIDDANSVANVGILIGEKSEWGKGYGTEAWQAFCDHLLNNGIRKVEGGCMAINMGMIHIFRKSGMFYEGRRHAHFLCGQETVDMVMYGKFGG